MRVLVLGSGAREHAIAWKFAQSNRITGLFIAPGNAGTEDLGENLPDVSPTDTQRILQVCRNRRVDLVFVGPEQPLARGVVDTLETAGIPAIGPGKNAAKLESSKTFSKSLMQRYGIPTADATEFEDRKAFETHIENSDGTMVIKKSGLAAGKGVLESSDKRELLDFGNKILESDSLLVEDFLKGWEISVFALTDGQDYLTLLPCADFKKAGDEDVGANTGGMGAVCPVPPVSKALQSQIDKTIVRPTFEGMKQEGLSYRGVLYFGLMITDKGPRLLEYNVRFGDPETQVLLPLIKSDFVNVCEALVETKIAEFPLNLSQDSALGVVVAARGYPADYRKGVPVQSLPEDRNGRLLVFHASTTRDESGRVLTGGGRCFTVVGIGPTILTANVRAYEAVPDVVFDGAWSRLDIGRKFFISE